MNFVISSTITKISRLKTDLAKAKKLGRKSEQDILAFQIEETQSFLDKCLDADTHRVSSLRDSTFTSLPTKDAN